ncbi:hypothetical protein P3W85_29910 [Cupriavidus basilensis]|uniref:Uncharacterized protein n=1 Tax=Cupriavidus basilensis TaxID=68895 RepID=A0ABT6AWY0_9BURK|nr:hypothetical protein [Cupriavidus basilensis]MDF3837139.1 hypothetical protein [Cupriavidus basilensis]
MTGPRILSTEDLNLTERAARAAGFEVQRYRARDLEVVQVREPGGQWRQFDPLSDDAETFRLMVDCDVPPIPGTTAIIAAGGAVEMISNNPSRRAACRRAIVRAVAKDFMAVA